MMYKMVRERDEDSTDVKAGTVVKDKNRKQVSYRNEVVQLCEEYFMALLIPIEKRELDLSA